LKDKFSVDHILQFSPVDQAGQYANFTPIDIARLHFGLGFNSRASNTLSTLITLRQGIPNKAIPLDKDISLAHSTIEDLQFGAYYGSDIARASGEMAHIDQLGETQLRKFVEDVAKFYEVARKIDLKAAGKLTIGDLLSNNVRDKFLTKMKSPFRMKGLSREQRTSLYLMKKQGLAGKNKGDDIPVGLILPHSREAMKGLESLPIEKRKPEFDKYMNELKNDETWQFIFSLGMDKGRMMPKEERELLLGNLLAPAGLDKDVAEVVQKMPIRIAKSTPTRRLAFLVENLPQGHNLRKMGLELLKFHSPDSLTPMKIAEFVQEFDSQPLAEQEALEILARLPQEAQRQLNNLPKQQREQALATIKNESLLYRLIGFDEAQIKRYQANLEPYNRVAELEGRLKEGEKLPDDISIFNLARPSFRKKHSDLFDVNGAQIAYKVRHNTIEQMVDDRRWRTVDSLFPLDKNQRRNLVYGAIYGQGNSWEELFRSQNMEDHGLSTPLKSLFGTPHEFRYSTEKLVIKDYLRGADEVQAGYLLRRITRMITPGKENRNTQKQNIISRHLAYQLAGGQEAFNNFDKENRRRLLVFAKAFVRKGASKDWSVEEIQKMAISAGFSLPSPAEGQKLSFSNIEDLFGHIGLDGNIKNMTPPQLMVETMKTAEGEVGSLESKIESYADIASVVLATLESPEMRPFISQRDGWAQLRRQARQALGPINNRELSRRARNIDSAIERLERTATLSSPKQFLQAMRNQGWGEFSQEHNVLLPLAKSMQLQQQAALGKEDELKQLRGLSESYKLPDVRSIENNYRPILQNEKGESVALKVDMGRLMERVYGVSLGYSKVRDRLMNLNDVVREHGLSQEKWDEHFLPDMLFPLAQEMVRGGSAIIENAAFTAADDKERFYISIKPSAFSKKGTYNTYIDTFELPHEMSHVGINLLAEESKAGRIQLTEPLLEGLFGPGAYQAMVDPDTGNFHSRFYEQFRRNPTIYHNGNNSENEFLATQYGLLYHARHYNRRDSSYFIPSSQMPNYEGQRALDQLGRGSMSYTALRDRIEDYRQDLKVFDAERDFAIPESLSGNGIRPDHAEPNVDMMTYFESLKTGTTAGDGANIPIPQLPPTVGNLFETFNERMDGIDIFVQNVDEILQGDDPSVINVAIRTTNPNTDLDGVWQAMKIQLGIEQDENNPYQGHWGDATINLMGKYSQNDRFMPRSGLPVSATSISTMALSSRGHFIDEHNGLQDFQDGIVRIVPLGSKKFNPRNINEYVTSVNHVNILEAIKLKNKLGFAYHDMTQRLVLHFNQKQRSLPYSKAFQGEIAKGVVMPLTEEELGESLSKPIIYSEENKYTHGLLTSVITNTPQAHRSSAIEDLKMAGFQTLLPPLDNIDVAISAAQPDFSSSYWLSDEEIKGKLEFKQSLDRLREAQSIINNLRQKGVNVHFIEDTPELTRMKLKEWGSATPSIAGYEDETGRNLYISYSTFKTLASIRHESLHALINRLDNKEQTTQGIWDAILEAIKDDLELIGMAQAEFNTQQRENDNAPLEFSDNYRKGIYTRLHIPWFLEGFENRLRQNSLSRYYDDADVDRGLRTLEEIKQRTGSDYARADLSDIQSLESLKIVKSKFGGLQETLAYIDSALSDPTAEVVRISREQADFAQRLIRNDKAREILINRLYGKINMPLPDPLKPFGRADAAAQASSPLKIQIPELDLVSSPLSLDLDSGDTLRRMRQDEAQMQRDTDRLKRMFSSAIVPPQRLELPQPGFGEVEPLELGSIRLPETKTAYRAKAPPTTPINSSELPVTSYDTFPSSVTFVAPPPALPTATIKPIRTITSAIGRGLELKTRVLANDMVRFDLESPDIIGKPLATATGAINEQGVFLTSHIEVEIPDALPKLLEGILAKAARVIKTGDYSMRSELRPEAARAIKALSTNELKVSELPDRSGIDGYENIHHLMIESPQPAAVLPLAGILPRLTHENLSTLTAPASTSSPVLKQLGQLSASSPQSTQASLSMTANREHPTVTTRLKDGEVVTISRQPNSNNIRAVRNGWEWVGSLRFRTDKKGRVRSVAIGVAEASRRKGLGTALHAYAYRFVEGYSLPEDGTRTDDGQALRDSLTPEVIAGVKFDVFSPPGTTEISSPLAAPAKISSPVLERLGRIEPVSSLTSEVQRRASSPVVLSNNDISLGYESSIQVTLAPETEQPVLLKVVKYEDLPQALKEKGVNQAVGYFIVDNNGGFKGLRNNEEVIIGRNNPGRFVLNDYVSRRHIKIRRTGDIIRITDLGSSNKTHVELPEAISNLQGLPVFEIGTKLGKNGHFIAGGVSRGRNGAREIIRVDWERDRALNQLYNNILQEAGFSGRNGALSGREKGDVLRRVYAAVKKHIVADENAAEMLARKFMNQEVLLGEAVIGKGGVCRHQGIVSAAFLERFIKEGYLSGQAYYFRGPGHGWSVYQTSAGKFMVFDVMQNYLGPMEGAKHYGGHGQYHYYSAAVPSEILNQPLQGKSPNQTEIVSSPLAAPESISSPVLERLGTPLTYAVEEPTIASIAKNQDSSSLTEPRIPEGWTHLVHGTNYARRQWDSYSPFINNELVVNSGGLSVIEKWRYDQNKIRATHDTTSNYAHYSRDLRPDLSDEEFNRRDITFEVRVMLPNVYPRLPPGQAPQEMLDKYGINVVEFGKDVFWRNGQQGRHPLIPRKTKLIQIAQTQNNAGQPILWYVPEVVKDLYTKTLTSSPISQPTQLTDAVKQPAFSSPIGRNWDKQPLTALEPPHVTYAVTEPVIEQVSSPAAIPVHRFGELFGGNAEGLVSVFRNGSGNYAKEHPSLSGVEYSWLKAKPRVDLRLRGRVYRLGQDTKIDAIVAGLYRQARETYKGELDPGIVRIAQERGIDLESLVTVIPGFELSEHNQPFPADVFLNARVSHRHQDPVQYELDSQFLSELGAAGYSAFEYPDWHKLAGEILVFDKNALSAADSIEPMKIESLDITRPPAQISSPVKIDELPIPKLDSIAPHKTFSSPVRAPPKLRPPQPLATNIGIINNNIGFGIGGRFGIGFGGGGAAMGGLSSPIAGGARSFGRAGIGGGIGLGSIGGRSSLDRLRPPERIKRQPALSSPIGKVFAERIKNNLLAPSSPVKTDIPGHETQPSPSQIPQTVPIAASPVSAPQAPQHTSSPIINLEAIPAALSSPIVLPGPSARVLGAQLVDIMRIEGRMTLGGPRGPTVPKPVVSSPTYNRAAGPREYKNTDNFSNPLDTNELRKASSPSASSEFAFSSPIDQLSSPARLDEYSRGVFVPEIADIQPITFDNASSPVTYAVNLHGSTYVQSLADKASRLRNMTGLKEKEREMLVRHAK
ncbi:FHA domain-containing protein, partial [Candidatus Omnitrophota bacterium]